jgi:hypothetical protein
MMDKRPLSLTIIAWLLIVTSVFGIISGLMMGSNEVASAMVAESPLPVGAHQAIGILSSVIALVCGVGVLKGWNWSRYVYVVAGVLGLVFNLVTVPMVSMIILGLLFLGVFVFFMFRPAANAWFTQTPRAVSVE